MKYFLFFLLFLPFPSVSSAASLGGPYEIDREIPSGPATLQEGGGFLLAGGFQSSAGLESAGASTLTFLSGYFIFRSTYTQPTLARASGDVKVRGDLNLGVSSSAPAQFQFSAPVSPGSLAKATTVYLISDNLGNTWNDPIAFSVAYNPSLQAEEVTIPGGWKSGHTYKIAVGTGVVDIEGNAVAASQSLNIQVHHDFSERNVLLAHGDPSARLEISPNALSGRGSIVFHSNPLAEPDRASPSQIQSANLKATANLGGQGQPFQIKELNAYDNKNQHMAQGFSSPVMLSLSYADSNNDGLLDSNPSIRAKGLGVWVLDESSSLWVKVPGSRVDLKNKKVTASLLHFSVYALIAAQDADVSQAYAYPIPWRPFAGDAARYGSLSDGIRFVNIPQTGTIRIYTLSGALVREQVLDGSLLWKWDGKNGAGEDSASGVYLWSVASGENKKTGKLMIVR